MSVTGAWMMISAARTKTAKALLLEREARRILAESCDEERPRELCAVAGALFKLGLRDRSSRTICGALEAARSVRRKSPWKFTNSLCYIACEMSRNRMEKEAIRSILKEALRSVPSIDRHYLKRRNEILSYLKGFRDSRRLSGRLGFLPKSSLEVRRRPQARDGQTGVASPYKPFEPKAKSAWTGVRASAPANEKLDSLVSRIYLRDDESEALASFAARYPGEAAVLGFVSRLDEEWRRAVALVILSRLLREKGDVSNASRLLDLALATARRVRFYWVRDSAIEILAKEFMDVSFSSGGRAALRKAKVSCRLIEDPWKRSRSLCYFASVEAGSGMAEEAAADVELVYRELLPRIRYDDRKAMSLLLISELHEEIGDEDEACRIRRMASSTLASLSPGKRKKSLEEFFEFISIRKGAARLAALREAGGKRGARVPKAAARRL